MKGLKKYLVPVTAAALIATTTFSISNLQVSAQSETVSKIQETSVIPENTTTMAFRVFKESDLAETSSMGKFMEPTAQIEKTADGKIYVYAVIKSAQLWKSYKTEVNGKMVDVEFLSEDKVADTKIVKFEVTSLNDIIKSEVAIQVGTQVLPQTTYTKFEETTVEKPVIQTPTEFKIWNTYEKKRQSQVKDYIISPLVTFEQDKKKYVQFTIKDASYWDSLQTELSGKLFAATIVSEDKEANTRVYRFEINSEEKLTMLIIHLKQPGVYDTTHVKFLDLTKAVAVVDPNKVVSTTKYTYSLVTKSKKEKSVADSYVVKPLKVEKTQAGKYYATVTLKNASMWKTIKTDVNGKMTTVKTVSTNKDKNTKVIKFQVKSAKASTKTTFTLNSKSKKVAGKYTNYFKINSVVK